MEQYRSGHNEPDSKSGSPKGPVGSNPTCSAKISNVNFKFLILKQKTSIQLV